MSSSARRALKILAAFGSAGRAMGVTEIARAMGVAPGTAFRGLDALQRANLVARHPSGPRYVLGPAALGLRQSLLSQFPLRDVCLPYLRQLASASGETCSLHVRIGWCAARIATVPGAAEVTSGASLSGAESLSSTIAGRAILAHLGKAEIGRYLAWLSSRGLKTPAGFERDLAAIRTRGFAQGSGTESAMAFPICKLDQAFASIAMEGSGLVAASSIAVRAAEWQETARVIEAVVRANPALCYQPFEHFDADGIALPS